MTQFNTNVGMNFINRYDRNQDGLSKQELAQGKMHSYFSMMSSMMTGNMAGFMGAFQGLQTANLMEQGFGVLSQASTGHVPDNPQTISGNDLLKTASNDGNMRNVSSQDMKSQHQQNQQKRQMPPMMQMFMQMMQMMMQMMMKMMGMQQQQPQQATGPQQMLHNNLMVHKLINLYGTNHCHISKTISNRITGATMVKYSNHNNLKTQCHLMVVSGVQH